MKFVNTICLVLIAAALVSIALDLEDINNKTPTTLIRCENEKYPSWYDVSEGYETLPNSVCWGDEGQFR